MAVQIQIRRGIGTEWSNVNPILADGEIAYDKTNKQLKIGDGSSNWITLPYFTPGAPVTIGLDTQVTQLVVAGVITAQSYVSTASTGTAPISVTSTTLNTNFNADLLDGQHGTYYRNASNINAGTLSTTVFPTSISFDTLTINQYASFNNLTASGIATFGSSVKIDSNTGIVTANQYQGSSINLTGVGIITASYYDGSTIKLESSTGIVTATSYRGDGSQLTGIVTSIVAGNNVSISSSTGQVTISATGGGGGSGSGIGTPLSTDPDDPLNLIYKTPKSTTIPPNTLSVVTSDTASGNIAFTRLDSIVVSTGSTLTVSTGTTFIMNVLNIF